MHNSVYIKYVNSQCQPRRRNAEFFSIKRMLEAIIVSAIITTKARAESEFVTTICCLMYPSHVEMYVTIAVRRETMASTKKMIPKGLE